ncbi:MAG TPA: hypothetical protein VKC51_01150 [Lacunisphaera sp.]|nr:hypothetical protein [Lacunisphaera sp.]
MNLVLVDARFGRELPVWAVLCEFQHPAEITAMVLGTGLCIAGFAWFSAGEVMAATPGRRQFVRALKMSAWLKAASLLGVGLAGVKELGLGQLNSFGWTLLTTLVQGALIAAELALLALGVFSWWRAWAWLKPQLLVSPARLAG